ncbi:copper transporter, partial [Pseudomonas aeruginosa]|nr:copper transporter [Pseudomonas aeruginosa]
GVHARLRLIPNLNAESLPKLGWHIAAITLVGLCFVAVGQSFRFGGAF